MKLYEQRVATHAAEAVSRGAEVLDRTYPNWWLRIDRDRLDLARSVDCIAGQLGATLGPEFREGWRSGYIALLRLLGLADRMPEVEVDYGFDVPDWAWDSGGEVQDACYQALREAWLSAIDDRMTH